MKTPLIRSLPLLLITALSAALGSVGNGAGQARADDVIVFRDVRVFDGAKVVPSTTVVVKDGMIAQVGDGGPVPEGAKVIDGKGKTLLPGFFDCHTHAFSPDHLSQAVIFGVTTELDMFTDQEFAARMRSEQAAGKARDRADLLSAGTLVTAPGGHGTEYGLKIPTITAPDQAQAFVDARIAEGSDYIKIVYDDGKEIRFPWPTINRETLAAVIKAAHAKKKLAVVHVLAREFARDALAVGADGLVHVFVDQPVDDDFVKLAADKKAFVIPTLTVTASINSGAGGATLADDPALAPWLKPADVAALKASFPRPPGGATEGPSIPIETVRKLKAAGVLILAGTDAINPGTAHGASIHRELELLVTAGLSPTEALAAATSLPASKFGQTNRGRIAAGQRADLVLVAGDPTSDIKATRAIVGVWKQGQPIDRDAYREAIRKQTDELAKAKGTPAPPGSEKGLVSDFEGKKVESAFGSGWSISTDVFVGGKSKAEVALVPGGANDSAGAMQIKGTVEDKAQPRWAGAMFSPGAAAMAPANLTSKKAITFSAKGDGKTYAIMLFSEAKGFMPATQSFVAGADWKQHRFALKDFDGSDGTGVMGIFIGSSADAGPFEIRIDDVRFE